MLPRDFIRQAIESKSSETYNKYCEAIRPIYGVSPNGSPKHIGSSVLVQSGEQKFLITAAHITDQSKVTSLHVGGMEKLVPLEAVAINTSMPPTGRKDDHLDFSIFPLEDKTCKNLGSVRYIEPEDMYPDDCAKVTTYYTCIGYPCSKNKKLSVTEASLIPARWRYSWHSIAPERYSILGITELSHVAVKFDQENSQTAEGTRVNANSPMGMSGGALFRLCEEDSSGLSSTQTDGRLVGILIEHPRKNEKAIVAVRIALVLRAIVNQYPELNAFFPTSSRLKISILH